MLEASDCIAYMLPSYHQVLQCYFSDFQAKSSDIVRICNLLCTHKSIIVSQVCFCEEDLSRLFPIRWTDFAQARFREERSGLLAGLKLVAERRLLREKLAKTNPSSVMIPIKRCGYTVDLQRGCWKLAIASPICCLVTIGFYNATFRTFRPNPFVHIIRL